jgi:integrase/recombinase XerD
MDYQDYTTFLTVKKRLSKRTIQEALIHARVIERRLNGDYTTSSVEQFLYAKKGDGLKNTTLNTYITELQRIRDYRLSRGLGEDFLQDIHYFEEERSPVDILTEDELKRFLATDIPYYNNHRGGTLSNLNYIYKTFYRFLIETGCRFSEASTLTWDKVDNKSVIFTETKNKSFRKVPITDNLYKQLIGLGTTTGLVFLSSRNTRIIPQSIYNDLRARAKLAGINKRIYMHLFRHTFITHLIVAGVDISTVALLAGHKKLDTTNWYTHLNTEHLEKSIRRLPIIREQTAPQEVSHTIVEVIKGFKLEADRRFRYRLVEGSKGLTFTLSW